MISARGHFGTTDRQRLKEWHNHQRHLAETRRDFQAREKAATDEIDSDVFAAVTTVVATEQQLQEFSIRLDDFDARLDTYHQASVEALIAVNERLDKINEELAETRLELDQMREDAHELEDGRRIFTNADGTMAIDLDGNRIAIEEVPFDEVPLPARIADQYLKAKDREQALVDARTAVQQEIQAIHDFDERRAEMDGRVDDIRSKIEDGDVTSAELDDLESELEAMDAELLDIMPASVRARVPGLDAGDAKPGYKTGFEDAAPTGTTPAVPNATSVNAPMFNHGG